MTKEFAMDRFISFHSLKKALEILNDPTEEELEVFSKLHKYYLSTTLYESAPQKTTQVIEYRPYALHSHQDIFAQRHSGVCHEGARHDRSKRDRFIGYQFIDPKRTPLDTKNLAAELKRTFLQDLEKRGIKKVEILEQKVWPYFYHFENEEIIQGYPWKILEMQGKKRTLYAGASACFESVNDVINYNIMLLHRFAPGDNLLSSIQ